MKTPVFDLHRSVYFNDLADRWDSLGQPPSEARMRGLLDRLGLKPGDTVMDLGTGTGLLIPYIFKYAPGAVIAADLSAKMLAKIEEKYAGVYGDKLRLLHADVHGLDLADQSVEVIICNGTFPHFADKALALAQIFRVLRPAGVLAINHFTSKETVNALHAGSANAYIRQDLLEPAARLAARLETAGFLVREALDHELEYCVIATKP